MIKRTCLLICLVLIISLAAYPASDKRHFILGNEEGDGFLIYPRQIMEGPDGNIYIYDRSDAFIKVYSPDGKYLRRIGGKGQGPGEIQRAEGANFGFTHDRRLCFTESFGGHRWITIMELSGELHKVLHPEINEIFGIANSLSLDNGGFLLEIWYMFKPEMKKDYFLYRYPQALTHINSNGEVVSEIIKTDYFKSISSGNSGADQWLPFFPAFAWIPWKGNSIVFADGLSRNLKVYDYEGKMVNEIESKLPEPEKVINKDLEDWRKMRKEVQTDKAWYERFGKVVEKYKNSVYDKKPNLSGISLTPDGNILISNPERSEEGIMDYWLIDDQGKILVQMNLGCDLLKISENFIFFRTTDADGNYLIHCYKRVEAEKNDLSSLKDLEILM